MRRFVTDEGKFDAAKSRVLPRLLVPSLTTCCPTLPESGQPCGQPRETLPPPPAS